MTNFESVSFPLKKFGFLNNYFLYSDLLKKGH